MRFWKQPHGVCATRRHRPGFVPELVHAVEEEGVLEVEKVFRGGKLGKALRSLCEADLSVQAPMLSYVFATLEKECRQHVVPKSLVGHMPRIENRKEALFGIVEDPS